MAREIWDRLILEILDGIQNPIEGIIDVLLETARCKELLGNVLSTTREWTIVMIGW